VKRNKTRHRALKRWMNKVLEEVKRMDRNKDLEIRRDQNRI
jgi:hypothetical protein